jgi:hypothetical protein
MIIVSWITVFFLGKQNIKRFMPASIFAVVFEAFNVFYAKKRKWWVFYNKPNSYITGEMPFNIGPFIVASMWILKWTYGNFKKYLLLNAGINASFAFIIIRIMDRLKVARLHKISHTQFFLYFFFKAFILYGFQYLVDKVRKKWGKNETSTSSAR